MLTIDLETHFYTQFAFDYLASRKDFPKMGQGMYPDIHYLYFTESIALMHDQGFIDNLCDLGEKRIAKMDKAGLDVAILSFSTPGLDECEGDNNQLIHLARQHNDILHEAFKRHPSRFGGFASLALQDIPAAVKELERAIQKLGFSGWLTHSNYGENKFLDDIRYPPLLAAAEAMLCPIYLHPTVPLSSEFGRYGFYLAGPALGFQFNASLCLMRMIYAGIFDQFPRLQVILGHLGETLPFLIPDRINWAYTNPNISALPAFVAERPKLKKIPSEVLLENVYVTTSGRFSQKTLDYTLAIMGEDRVMLATDYPYENLDNSMDFLMKGTLPHQILEKICATNAIKLGLWAKKETS